jgi:hypothetical protein
MKRKYLFTAGVLAFTFTFAACGDGSGGNDGTPVTLNSVTANGASSETTTQLTLTFSAAIAGLSANDINLSGVSGVSNCNATVLLSHIRRTRSFGKFLPLPPCFSVVIILLSAET